MLFLVLKKGSSDQNSSDYNHPIDKSPQANFPYPTPYPFMHERVNTIKLRNPLQRSKFVKVCLLIPS